MKAEIGSEMMVNETPEAMKLEIWRLRELLKGIEKKRSVKGARIELTRTIEAETGTVRYSAITTMASTEEEKKVSEVIAYAMMELIGMTMKEATTAPAEGSQP